MLIVYFRQPRIIQILELSTTSTILHGRIMGSRDILDLYCDLYNQSTTAEAYVQDEIILLLYIVVLVLVVPVHLLPLMPWFKD
jgi:hypothetical protein